MINYIQHLWYRLQGERHLGLAKPEHAIGMPFRPRYEATQYEITRIINGEMWGKRLHAGHDAPRSAAREYAETWIRRLWQQEEHYTRQRPHA